MSRTCKNEMVRPFLRVSRCVEIMVTSVMILVNNVCRVNVICMLRVNVENEKGGD